MKRLTPRLILALGWIAFFIHAYPGRMTRDSWDQLRQARSGIFLDDHPPLMQAIVWLTDPFIAGPMGIVILQSVLFLIGAYWILRRVISERSAAIGAVALLLFPPSVAVMVVMWKDPFMAGALLFAVALLLSPRRDAKLLGLGFVIVATGVRFNALAATFALVVLLFEWKPLPRLKRYGLALAVWFGITLAAFGINKLLTDRETHFFETTLVDDIVGTLNFVDGELSDAELRQALGGTRLRIDTNIHAGLRKAYRADTMLWYVLGDGRLFDLPLADVEQLSPELRARIAHVWKRIVFRNFGAYLQYRIDRFRVVLGLQREGETTWDDHLIVTHDYQDKATIWTFGVSTTTSALQGTLDEGLEYLSHSWLFRPYLYFLLSLSLLPFARRNVLALALLLSGLGIELSLFFLAHSPDYRYSHWMICTTVLAAILLFVERYRSRGLRNKSP